MSATLAAMERPDSSVHRDLCDLNLRAAVLLDEDSTLGDAARAFTEQRVTAALLLGRQCAIITERDIVRAAGQRIGMDEPARRVATPSPLMIPQSASVVEAAETMAHHGVGHLVVIDSELVPLAIVSARVLAEELLAELEQPTWLHQLRIALALP